MQAHLVKLGLLSLAGAPGMPKITLRKGAKAEPGTEMDTLLRNVLGDPDKAEDAETAEEPDEPEERAGAGEPSEAVDAQVEDGAGMPRPRRAMARAMRRWRRSPSRRVSRKRRQVQSRGKRSRSR